MMFITISQAVGRDAPNRSADVKAIHKALMDIGKVPCYVNNGLIDHHILQGIGSLQRHFMRLPDQVVSPHGATLGYLSGWQEKPVSPGVQLPGRLKEAWTWLNPLLPDRS